MASIFQLGEQLAAGLGQTEALLVMDSDRKGQNTSPMDAFPVD